MTINFISSEDDNDEEHVIDSKSDNREIMINDKENEGIEELVKSLRNIYQNHLEKSMKGREFVFYCVHLLYYKCYRINPNRGGSYIDSPDWIKNK